MPKSNIYSNKSIANRQLNITDKLELGSILSIGIYDSMLKHTVKAYHTFNSKWLPMLHALFYLEIKLISVMKLKISQIVNITSVIFLSQNTAITLRFKSKSLHK